MKVPLSWLKAYVEVKVPVDELAQRLTMAGVESSGVEHLGGWNDCYVGQVLAVEPHPNADRLQLCTVSIGEEQLQVVCGAPNVAPDQNIAFAKVGAKMFDTNSGKAEVLKPAKIRGVISEGMICSVLELGLGEQHDGILVLPEDAPVGTPLADYLGDVILDFEVTANRPDCLSVLGVAREVAAFQGTSITEPDISYPEHGETIDSLVAVEIADPEYCKRYTATLITGITIGPSPQWMQDRLNRAGQRPINNIVDVTNYAMLEYGQPLHAFDFDKVKDRKVIVRQAKANERHLTLDGIERKLQPPMMVIADSGGVIGLAGIMGGSNTEITEATTTILLESASWHPFNTRRTGDALKLRSEASQRFEKGWRPELSPIGLRRATKLMLDVAGGTVAKGVIDIYPGQQDPAKVTLTLAGLEKVLGIAVPLEEVTRTLTTLGFQCNPLEDYAVEATVPPWRADIAIEEDLVEEIARVIGYDRIPTTMLSTPIPLSQPDPPRELKEQVRELLASSGLQEVINYSLVSGGSIEATMGSDAGTDKKPELLRASNPISPKHEYLRTTLKPGLLLTLANNRRHDNVPHWYFEIGREYLFYGEDFPIEPEVAAGIMVGPGALSTWGTEETATGFYDAKGVLEILFERLGVIATYEVIDSTFYYPGRSAVITANSQQIGQLGEVHPTVLEHFDVRVEGVVYFEIDLSSLLMALPDVSRRFRGPSIYPGAHRDLALTVPVNIPAGNVQTIIEQHPLVARATLFDVYVGSQVQSGVRSLAYRVFLQAQDRTLTTEEVNKAMERTLARLEKDLGATQRH
ncbi:MAG: phenylalanine--tRNA ligase subunit beta [Chloroflexota bacterium]|nr:phenylalanine--tRNA ligase subunit beta [Chloroflexota bacterium]